MLLAPGIRAEEPPPDVDVEPVAPADEEAATYVGDAVCLACHDALQEGFGSHYAETIHAKVLTPQNALDERMGRGCEACHGPGSAHVEAGGGRGVPREFLTLRTIYRWEKYDRRNFHENFPITDSEGDIYLQNRIDDYDAHILSISAIVTF